jgi:hypothetical protein
MDSFWWLFRDTLRSMDFLTDEGVEDIIYSLLCSDVMSPENTGYCINVKREEGHHSAHFMPLLYQLQ